MMLRTGLSTGSIKRLIDSYTCAKNWFDWFTTLTANSNPITNCTITSITKTFTSSDTI